MTIIQDKIINSSKMSLVPLTDYNKFPDFVNSNKIIELISGNADLAKVREVISNAISTFIINHYGKQITNDTCIYVNVEKFRLNYNQINRQRFDKI